MELDHSLKYRYSLLRNNLKTKGSHSRTQARCPAAVFHSVTSVVQELVAQWLHKWQRAFYCGKPVTCWWAAPFPLRYEPSAHRQLELVELWKASRAGLKEVMNLWYTQLLTSGAFYSIELRLASLKAAQNLVFLLFWRRQQHLELSEHPLLQLHLNDVFLTGGRPGARHPLAAAPAIRLPPLSQGCSCLCTKAQLWPSPAA